MAENKNQEKKQGKGEKISIDNLEKVTGGSGLRKVHKEQRQEMTDDIRNRI